MILILVVVDNGLVPITLNNGTEYHPSVLILVVVDNGLVLMAKVSVGKNGQVS